MITGKSAYRKSGRSKCGAIGLGSNNLSACSRREHRAVLAVKSIRELDTVKVLMLKNPLLKRRLGFKMIKEDSEYRIQEPGILVFFVTVILSSVVSFALATYLLKLSPVWVALLAGAVCGVLGLFLGENIFDAIVFCFLMGLLVFIFIIVGPEIEIIRTAIVPMATGFCVGKLVYGIWKEISDKPT